MPVVLITGGTGLIGKSLTTQLIAKGYEVIIVSRTPPLSSDNSMVTYAAWDIAEKKMDGNAIARADYIVNLAGAGVMDKSWSKKYKTEIVESRVKSSELLIDALQTTPNKVKAIISASAIGWYGEDSKTLKDKYGFAETDPADDAFLGETCRLWEESIDPVTKLYKRLVKLRIGIVLSNDGGALAEFKKPLHFGIAGIPGSGKQVISWIHIDDLCRMFIYAIENDQLSGSYNAVAPSPISNKKLILKLGQKMRGQFYIPVHVPQFILKLMLGQRSTEILKSATVSCEKIKATGYTFLYPTIDTALNQLAGKKS